MTTPRTIRIIVLLWASFLPAAVASMLFFAAFDPAELALSATFPVDMSRMAGYALGFAFFWALAASAAWLTALLIGHDG